jgi:hypothetical protein
MPIKPITPDEIVEQKIRDLPDAVIEAWNRIIAQRYTGGSVIIMQDDVVEALLPLAGYDRGLIFNEGWLDIEELYRANGWKVEYDRPAYNESYRASFKFSRAR